MPSFVYTLITLSVTLGLFMLVTGLQSRRRKRLLPRITEGELDAFCARLAAASLPMVRVTLLPEAPNGATTSRVGGPPYADGPRRKWPVKGKDRHPMIFLAQINFAEVPPLEDFPRKGLLQVFVHADERGQLVGLERKADRVIRWYPEPDGSLTLTPPASLHAYPKHAAMSPRAVRLGLGLAFAPPIVGQANPYNWPYDATLAGFDKRLPENEDVGCRLKAFQEAPEFSTEKSDDHWIGGHPRFVQMDVREEPRLRKLNRVLLHLTDDGEDIHLGDSGELNLLIAHKDLRNADFDNAFVTWDCS